MFRRERRGVLSCTELELFFIFLRPFYCIPLQACEIGRLWVRAEKERRAPLVVAARTQKESVREAKRAPSGNESIAGVGPLLCRVSAGGGLYTRHENKLNRTTLKGCYPLI